MFTAGPAPDAIVLSHAHLDHAGLIRRSNPHTPIYATKGTSKMLLAGSMFALQPRIPSERFEELKDKVPFEVGDFRITPYAVDHSIYGCVALLIEASGKSLLYTGDFRLHGRKPSMAKQLVEAITQTELDLLLMEGTHFGLPDRKRVAEYELEDEMVNLVNQAPSLVLASFSPQNLDSLVGFIRTICKTKRTFVADAYTAFLLYLLSREVKNLPVPGKSEGFPVFFPKTFWQNESKRNWLAERCPFMFERRITTDQILSDPQRYLMVFRPSMLEPDFQSKLPDGVLCIHSRWEGYLEDQEWKTTRQEIEKAHGSLVQVHTSGHILSGDIVEFVQALSPKKIIPIHTFEPEEFARRLDNVELLNDGELYEVE